MGDEALVVLPMYKTKFLEEHEWDVHFKGNTNLGEWFFDFTIIKLKVLIIGFFLKERLWLRLKPKYLKIILKS
jgi:starch synthase